uniref:Protein Flattop n=1 Tax=Pygocentrus nattereri TaxID=42514 RepID=A0AAR2LQG1_PYGNA
VFVFCNVFFGLFWQYENAFKSHKLQNWTVPKHYKESQRPSAAEGHTAFIATDRGHLLPGVKRGSPWTSFQGTWDLPRRIPPVHINSTARSLEGQERLKAWGQSQYLVQSATDKPHEGHVSSRALSRTCDKVDRAHFCFGKFSTDNSHIEFSNRPVLFQNTDKELQDPAGTPAPDGEEPIPEKPSSQAQSRPGTQQSQAPSRPVSQQSHESRPPSQQNKAESRPTSQQDQMESGSKIRAIQDQSRPVSQTSRRGQ